MIIYTGTHDNDTLMEWYHGSECAPEGEKSAASKTPGNQDRVPSKTVCLAYTLESKAEYAIVPMADILGLGKEGHLNTPGTVGSPNWEWRMPDFERACTGTETI